MLSVPYLARMQNFFTSNWASDSLEKQGKEHMEQQMIYRGSEVALNNSLD